MCKQKNDERGYFFQAGQCAVLSSFRAENAVFVEKGCENTVNRGLK